jgi:NAD(P)-dependent dehydrogenase (short-subunit alcohol dehydrogenase family)
MAVKATAKLRHSTPMRALSAHAIPKRSSPRTWQPSELREGLAVGGVYASPDPPLDEFLLHVTGLCDRGLPRWQVAILLACSFVVGMELPGRQALFAALNVVFESGIEDDTPSFEYEACIDSYETRFDRAVVGVRFTRGTQTLARATMKAFARIEIPSAYSATTGPARAPADSARRVALVTGASRGLGASLSTALAERGWTVVGTYRESRVDAEALAAWAATTSGRFVPLRGDAADAIFWRDSIPRLIAEHSGIDLLVCNAFPPLQPLWIEPAAATRIVDYVGRSVAMTAIPLSHAIDAVATRRGTLLMISSACVHGDSVDWPHYVAAKGAIEGLARVVAAEFPAVRVIVARPPRLRTDFSNAPLARGEAMAPSRMAAILVERVGAARPEGGGVEIMETFEEGQTGGLS